MNFKIVPADFSLVLALALFAGVISWGCTIFIRRWALKKSILDIPNERSSHTQPTPRGGGIGIVLAVSIGGGTVLAVFHNKDIFGSLSFARLGMVALSAFLIAAISWLDDVRHGLPPAVRLAVHSAAAGLALFSLGGSTKIFLPFVGSVDFVWLGIPLALFWIVGLVNVYNFMDGIDGIAGVQAVTASLGWAIAGVLTNRIFLWALGLFICAAAIGFLIHNWPPARIFMGDVGSAFLGFCFAMIPFLGEHLFPGRFSERLPFAGLLMVAPFAVDGSFTLARRIVMREKISQAHRSHLYQRLVLSGLSHQSVTLLYAVLGLLGSSAGIFFLFSKDLLQRDTWILMISAAIFVIPFSLLKIRERHISLLRKIK